MGRGGGAVYRFVDHTGEVRLQLRAASLAELFTDAGLALAELLAGDRPRGEPAAPERVSLVSGDLGRLLADWIDELVFRSERGGMVPETFEPITVTERGELRAVVAGRRIEEVRTAVKAATLHRLRVERDGSGWSGEVVLDV